MISGKLSFVSQRLARIFYLLSAVSLIAGVILSLVQLPASAATGQEQAVALQLQDTQLAEEPACTPPEDWDQTVRLTNSRPTTDWSFIVEEPEMEVTLEFFYYQDYDRFGCPFDCDVPGNCQLFETGEGESPLGGVIVTDGHAGADGGSERLSGSLPQGEYTITFRFTGRGSLNIGLRVHKRPAPTQAPSETPTREATPAETETPTGEPPATETGLPPTDEPTATDTPPVTTVLPPQETLTATPTASPPPDTATPTPTPTDAQPPRATRTPTETPVTTVLPPAETGTPTEVDQTPPATMAPPTPPRGATRTPALVPATGVDRSGSDPQSFPLPRLFFSLGAAFLGLGLVFHGIGRQSSIRG